MNNIVKMIVMLLYLVMVAMFCSCEPEIDDNNTQTTPTTHDTPNTPTDTVVCGETVGEWVDLGLPSGLLWYSVNLGATSPEQYGDYYAWGETRPKSDYRCSTYRYCTVDADGDHQTFTKYNTKETYGTVDNLTTLQPSDDAATAVLGGGARMPTMDEWQELLENTTAEWTTQSGVNGRRFTGTNGNSIFLPAAGNRYGSELYFAGERGDYWSSSLRTDFPNLAWDCYFGSGSQHVSSPGRDHGQSVRAVRASQN